MTKSKNKKKSKTPKPWPKEEQIIGGSSKQPDYKKRRELIKKLLKK